MSKNKKKKMPVKKQALVVKAYPVLDQAVENGIAYGLTRAFKHLDGDLNLEKHGDMAREALQNAVMCEICEWFDIPALNELDKE